MIEEQSEIQIPDAVFSHRSIVVGVSGAHRTGKTETAKRVAEYLDLPMVETNVSKSSVWSSISPSDSITFGERIQVQEIILNDIVNCILKANEQNPQGFVTDRTPFDVLAYLLTNIDSTTSSIFDDRVDSFIQRVISACDPFTHLVTIQPGIPFVVAGGKSSKVYNSRVYQEALTNTIIGMTHRYYELLSPGKVLISVPRKLIEIEERVKFISSVISLFN